MHIKDISSSIYEDSLLKNLIWNFSQFSKIGNLNIVVIAHPSLVNIGYYNDVGDDKSAKATSLQPLGNEVRHNDRRVTVNFRTI